MKNFFKKVGRFIKRNAYALAVCVCVILVLTLITVTAVTLSTNRLQSDAPDEDIPSVPSSSGSVITFVSPVVDGEVSKNYAEDYLLEDNTSGIWQTHQGIDFRAKEGAKVVCVYDGVVEKIEHSMMDGVIITIKHANNLKSVYKCLADEVMVNEKDKVVKGQQIGAVASSLTEKADGPHIHFELYEGEKLIDPTPYLDFEGK